MQCQYCGKACIQQQFNTATHQWEWSHESCRPYKPIRERRYTRENSPMGYVPRSYEGVRREQIGDAERGPSEVMGRAIRQQQRERGELR